MQLLICLQSVHCTTKCHQHADQGTALESRTTQLSRRSLNHLNRAECPGTYIYLHTHTRARARARTHTHTHTEGSAAGFPRDTHTHTHTYIYILFIYLYTRPRHSLNFLLLLLTGRYPIVHQSESWISPV